MRIVPRLVMSNGSHNNMKIQITMSEEQAAEIASILCKEAAPQSIAEIVSDGICMVTTDIEIWGSRYAMDCDSGIKIERIEE